MSLCVVVARANYLCNKNELNDKEKKKEIERERNKQYLYVRSITLFEILICSRYRKVSA